MRILLYGINFSPELTGIGKYSGEFARWCVKQGHEVHVLTAPPYYPDWRVWEGYPRFSYTREKDDGVDVTRCPLYVPRKPSTFRRMLHLFSFSFSSFFALFRNLFWKPDVLVVVAPTILCAPSALIFSRISRVKSVLHIQDFELDAMFGLSMAGGARFGQLAYWFERKILRLFDHISTISEGMLERAVGKGVDREKLILFPNWSDLEHFRGAERNEALLTRLGVDLSKKLILYAGSMGEKQGLEVIVEVAERARNSDKLQFLFVGEGGAKYKLVAECQRRQLNNIIFAPLQPYAVLPSLLASADCHLVIQRRGAADSVLPSKLTNILAVGGNAVITADPDTSLGKLTREWPGIAFLVEPESASSLAQGIKRALAAPTVNTVATNYAEQCLDMDAVLRRFLRSIGV